ncbi:MAG: hypothetical protein ACREJQ_00990, partial [bacterium]
MPTPAFIRKELFVRLAWVVLLLTAALFSGNIADLLLRVNFVPVASLGCTLSLAYQPASIFLLLLAVCVASGER